MLYPSIGLGQTTVNAPTVSLPQTPPCEGLGLGELRCIEAWEVKHKQDYQKTFNRNLWYLMRDANEAAQRERRLSGLGGANCLDPAELRKALREVLEELGMRATTQQRDSRAPYRKGGWEGPIPKTHEEKVQAFDEYEKKQREAVSNRINLVGTGAYVEELLKTERAACFGSANSCPWN